MKTPDFFTGAGSADQRQQEGETRYDLLEKFFFHVYLLHLIFNYSNASTCSRSGMERMAPFLVVTR